MIYIDNDYKCYAEPAEGRKAIGIDLFDGMCKTYIEGYRFVPKGEVWVREDGEVFEGETLFPWKPFSQLLAAQQGYEESLAELQDMQAALELLAVKPIDEVNE